MKVFLKILGIALVIFIIVMAIRHGSNKDNKNISSMDDRDVVTTQAKDRQEVHDLVLAFGASLQKVSLLSPLASAQIQKEYVPFLTKSLLDRWAAQPSVAAGRSVSSPWPDHIDIIDNERTPQGTYEVRATVVYVTSVEQGKNTAASTNTVEMVVVKEGGMWRIDSYTVVDHKEGTRASTGTEHPQPE